jgi:hypothetical protein
MWRVKGSACGVCSGCSVVCDTPLMVLLGDNLEYFQSNLSMHGMDTRKKALLYKTLTNPTCFQKGVFYAGIKKDLQ